MELSVIFLTLGGLFLAGLASDLIGRRMRLPRVTLLLLCGLAAGGSGFGWLPEAAFEWYEFLSVLALTLVAFLLGSSLTRDNLARHGRVIMWVSISVVLVTVLIVSAGLALVGVDPALALILGAIATATAPAATIDVIRQSGVRNGFTDTIEGIVAIDDAWGLLVFSVVLTVAGVISGNGHDGAIFETLREIFGAVLLGVAVGLPGAYLTGRITEGEPLQAEALAIVFLTAGAAMAFDVSFLIAGMTAGAVVVNLARHHERSFHEIEHIQWPFMLLFFILAGSSLELRELAAVGWIGVAYVVLRIVARLIGATFGAVVGGAPRGERPYFGLALMPQAGVAVGMALVASKAFPEHGSAVLAITIASTVVFELFGPLATNWAIRRVAGRA